MNTSPQKLPVQFDRDFQIWKYDVSHAQLLLWSVKGNTQKTRVEVLFKSVHLMQLPTNFSRLRILEITKEEFQASRLSLGLSSDLGMRYFLVEGNGWKGLVVAGAVFWSEEDAEHYDPSKLLSLPPGR